MAAFVNHVQQSAIGAKALLAQNNGGSSLGGIEILGFLVLVAAAVVALTHLARRQGLKRSVLDDRAAIWATPYSAWWFGKR